MCFYIAILPTYIWGLSGTVTADTVLTTSVKLKTPKKATRGDERLDAVTVSIWIPEKVKVLRGVIVNPFYVNLVERKDYHQAARLWEFALIGANFFGVKTDDYDALLSAMKEFAEKSGHKEIEHLPILFNGFSAGSGMLMKMAKLWPERVIACGPVGLEVGPDTPKTRKIPTITVFGEKDMHQMEILTKKLPEQRKEGALWAIAVNWGLRHEYANANDLVWPFFDQVIRYRLPRNQTSLTGPVKLRDYREEDGWLGDISTWDSASASISSYKDYKGDRSKAAWLPNRYVAHTWQAFVSRSSGLTIKQPISKPEEKTSLIIGAKFPIVTTGLTSVENKRVEYFDGHNLLLSTTGDSQRVVINGLPTGVRSLIAVEKFNNKQLVSKPVAVVVNPVPKPPAPLQGKVSIVLEGALFQERILDGKPYKGPPVPLYLETFHEDGRWEGIIGNAPSFNRGHHRGRVLNCELDPQYVDLTIEMNINSDPWIPGGRAEYEIALKGAGVNQFEGVFTGTFRGKRLSGKSSAERIELPQPPKDFVPFKSGEHPRILFRKSDIPALKQKAKTSIGQVAMEKIKSEENDAVALGVMYQFTGDKIYAEKTIQLVRAKTKERGAGAFSTGHIWGERLSYVALAYDLCKEAWDEEFISEVQNYLNWITERLIFRPRSVSAKVNYSPNSNYHAWLRGGAGIGSLALVGDKGAEPQPPRKPPAKPERLEAIKDFTPGADVPVTPFANDRMPRWITAGPFPFGDTGMDLLADLGGPEKAHPKPGMELVWKDNKLRFKMLDEKHLWQHPSFTKDVAIDLTSAADRKFYTTSYYYAVVKNSKDRLVEFVTGASGGTRLRFWISGKEFRDKDYLQLSAGLHPIMVRAHITETSSWGKLWMEPRFVEVTMKNAQDDLSKRLEEYELATAEWKEDHKAWEEAEGASPRWLYLAELAKYHMDQYYRYCFGDGGWQTEGEGYTLYSCVLPLEYAQAYKRMYGVPVSSRPDVSHFAPRYIMQTIYGGKRLTSQSFSLASGTMHSGHYARAFPLVPDEWKPAMLWAWNKTMDTRGEGEGEPKMRDLMTAIYTLLNYPTEMKAKNPGECMPLTWSATTKGGYILRNLWRDTDDIVAQVFLKSEGEGGWSHPDAGSIRIYGLGHEWAIVGVNNSKAGSRWFENVVMLPEDGVNEGMRAIRTYYDTKENGSGIISMDMNLVYSGTKITKDNKGEEKKANLVDHGFRLLRENLLDLSIRGMRSVAVDYSGKSGAPALFAIVDKISGGKTKVWQWQLPKLDDSSTRVDIKENTFTITQGNTSLVATFIAPADVKLSPAKGKENIHLKYGKYGDVNLNAIHALLESRKNKPLTGQATGGDSFFVVMTLQRGEPPNVKVEGTGLNAKVTIGEQTITFDGEKIILHK